MLVFLLLIFNIADFCQGKAFPEAEKNRGKRSYSHAPSAGIHQTYDSQSNAELWMKGNFYQPQIDGQPIYVPSLDQPGSYNEFLDAYYKAYTPAWNLATPVPYTYNTKSAYKNTGKTTFKDYVQNNAKYAPASSKESQLSVEKMFDDYAPESEDYGVPENIVKTIATEFNNEDTNEFSHGNSDLVTSDLDEFEEPVILESFKKSELPKSKPKEYDQFDEPAVIKTVKQKPKPKDDQYDEPVIIKTVKQKPKPKDDQYDEPVIMKTVKQKPKPKDDQYDEPVIMKTVKQKPKPKDDQYDEPVIMKTVKQKPKPKDDQYDEPVIMKTVKQKPKPKDDQYDEPVIMKTVKQKPKPKDDQYDEPVIMKTVKPKPKPKDDQYDEPVIIKTVKQKPKPKDDQYDEPVIMKTVKQKPKPKDDQYDEPVIMKTVKQKPKPKDDQSDEPVVIKTVKQIPKPKDDQYQPDVIKTVKQSPLSVEKIPSDYDAPESEDYDNPEIIDKTIVMDSNNEDSELSHQNTDLATSESNDLDEFEEQIVAESLKKSELPNIKPKDYDKYDEPSVIKTVKQKSKPLDDQSNPAVIKTVKQKINVKTDAPKKSSIQKPNLQLENADDYGKPVHKIVKGKPNKKKVHSSAKKYSDRTSPATRKKSKGKRRKQYSKTNKPRTGEEAIGNTFDGKTVGETPDELTKKGGELYQSRDTQIEIEEKSSVVKTDKKKQSQTKETMVGKTDLQYEPGKIKEMTVKQNAKGEPTNSYTRNKPAKTDEMEVAETNSQYRPVKTKGEVTKSDSKDKPMKTKANIKYTEVLDGKVLTRQLNDENLAENDKSIDNKLKNEPNRTGNSDATESEFPEKLVNTELSTAENDQNSEVSISSVVKPDSIFKNIDDFRGLSSMNSNIWSMLFNPNAEQNRLKQKRCITRSNETGFCTYIQNCEVPHIATSLDQLLNNACVIDDIFIGVCCPEFPVETVKVHWDQKPSDFDNQIEDEFGHNAEGELIKSWCDGYEESLTNLLISFSLADCGARSNESSELQSWPWKAPLVSMSNGKIFCGGVVVSEDHILTAAHCTTKIPKNQILVRLGQYDDGSGDDYAVVEIKRHAQYNPRTMQNDVALLKLGLRIMNDAHIGIVCLPDEDDKNNHVGETATLLGWRGIFGTKSRDPEFLKVIPNKECEKKLGMKVTSNTLCTETRKESERTCNADSGAPLVIKDDGKYEVIGILSWNRNDCDQRFPSTFSRVSSYTGWIRNHIS